MATRMMLVVAALLVAGCHVCPPAEQRSLAVKGVLAGGSNGYTRPFSDWVQGVAVDVQWYPQYFRVEGDVLVLPDPVNLTAVELRDASGNLLVEAKSAPVLGRPNRVFGVSMKTNLEVGSRTVKLKAVNGTSAAPNQSFVVTVTELDESGHVP